MDTWLSTKMQLTKTETLASTTVGKGCGSSTALGKLRQLDRKFSKHFWSSFKKRYLGHRDGCSSKQWFRDHARLVKACCQIRKRSR
jgi:hypothetical protein